MSARPAPPEGARPGLRDVLLRRMTRDDLPRVTRMERETFTMAWSPATFRGLLRRRDVSAFVAEVDDRLAGYAVCWYVYEQGELANIAVAPDLRGMGLGERLLDETLREMERQGVRQVYLEVRESNRAAQRFYDRLGFRVVGRRRGYYVKPKEDALVYYRPLAADEGTGTGTGTGTGMPPDEGLLEGGGDE